VSTIILKDCCNTLIASACTSDRYETITETREERGNVKFRKWHDNKLQQKEQWRPGDNFEVFPHKHSLRG